VGTRPEGPQAVGVEVRVRLRDTKATLGLGGGGAAGTAGRETRGLTARQL